MPKKHIYMDRRTIKQKKSRTKTCLKFSEEDGKRVLPFITDFSARSVHFSFSLLRIESTEYFFNCTYKLARKFQ